MWRVRLKIQNFHKKFGNKKIYIENIIILIDINKNKDWRHGQRLTTVYLEMLYVKVERIEEKSTEGGVYSPFF